ncbi:rifin [Plasmodium reichenowi]|uniref:Rifin n=1 Tax=Plasmodium reichenowi TaxID=5854 RepID=A0A060RM96_PLARE|nr:rifin [Plasmodium reichenowi]
MKVHYINILLFVLPLNILEHNQWNHYMKPHTYTNRSLCKCELYAPANYDNDPQMKSVMQQFEDRTSQRFHEYDERMKTTRQKCKERCDKEIQKILLKDKLEKELMDKFATLDTDIQSDAIPSCVCEKSIADKVEKGCLRCGSILGAAMPELGSIGGSLLSALYAWKPAALEAATKYALKEGLAFGKIIGEAKGKEIVIKFLKEWGVDYFCPDFYNSIGTKIHYTNIAKFAESILTQQQRACSVGADPSVNAMCSKFNVSFGIKNEAGISIGAPGPGPVENVLNGLVKKATGTADHVTTTTTKGVADIITRQQTSEIASTYMANQTAIIASIVAILIIILIMVIIYLILRYRRKKKMKKKLQYIKLLEE